MASLIAPTSSCHAKIDSPDFTKDEVKQIAKQYYLKKSTVRQAQAAGKLNDDTHLTALSTLLSYNNAAFNNYSRDVRFVGFAVSAKKLNKIFANAYFTLESGKSIELLPGIWESKILVTKNAKGRIRLFQRCGIEVEGSTCEIVRYRSILKPDKTYMVKYALNQRGVRYLDDEFSELNSIHKEIKKKGLTTIGIQLKPKCKIDFQSNKPLRPGMMTDEYRTDCARISGRTYAVVNANELLTKGFSCLALLFKLQRRHADIKPDNLFLDPQCMGQCDVHISDYEDSRKLSLKAPVKTFTDKPLYTTNFYNVNDKIRLDELRYKLKKCNKIKN